jgi:hypothetical protein
MAKFDPIPRSARVQAATPSGVRPGERVLEPSTHPIEEADGSRGPVSCRFNVNTVTLPDRTAWDGHRSRNRHMSVTVTSWCPLTACEETRRPPIGWRVFR